MLLHSCLFTSPPKWKTMYAISLSKEPQEFHLTRRGQYKTVYRASPQNNTLNSPIHLFQTALSPLNLVPYLRTTTILCPLQTQSPHHIKLVLHSRLHNYANTLRTVPLQYLHRLHNQPDYFLAYLQDTQHHYHVHPSKPILITSLPLTSKLTLFIIS